MRNTILKISNFVMLAPAMVFASTIGDNVASGVEEAKGISNNVVTLIKVVLLIVGIIIFAVGAAKLYKSKQEQGGAMAGGTAIAAGLLIAASSMIVSSFAGI